MFNLTQQDMKKSRFYQQVFAEGRVEGEAKGAAKGRVEGETALLRRQLERKFGPLPAAAQQRLSAADAETLLVWGERLLDARSLDEVWGD